ncbi:hypothetical protein AB1Y20_013588 [Prymnesium parvum]|uniref:JmjC domain-containing protein n=1 Tax=Prymnesium parvum TaxID=97485 RepID=A0AB34IH28_PRYPA
MAVSSRIHMASAAAITAAALAAWLLHLVLHEPDAPPVPRTSFCSRCNTSHEELVRLVASRREPRVLSASPSARWDALHRWTPEYLASALRVLPVVYGLDRGRFVYHEPSREMGARLRLAVPRAHTVRYNVSAADFFLGARTEPLYMADKLWRQPYKSAISMDAEPRDFMSATADLPETLGQDAIFWAGDAGTTAQPHYDSTHTLFAQVRGERHFELWPPEQWERFGLYPHAHPGHRQALLELEPHERPAALQGCTPPSLLSRVRHAASWGRRAIAQLRAAEEPSEQAPLDRRCEGALQVVLTPGELLYIPPYWFHRVSSRTQSVAVSVVTDSHEGSRFDDACRRGLPTSLLNARDPDERARAAHRLIFLLLSSFDHRHDAQAVA